MPFRPAQLVVGQSGRGDDRVAVHELQGRLLIIVADGAGGSGGEHRVADAVTRLVTVGLAK